MMDDVTLGLTNAKTYSLGLAAGNPVFSTHASNYSSPTSFEILENLFDLFQRTSTIDNSDNSTLGNIDNNGFNKKLVSLTLKRLQGSKELCSGSWVLSFVLYGLGNIISASITSGD